MCGNKAKSASYHMCEYSSRRSSSPVGFGRKPNWLVDGGRQDCPRAQGRGMLSWETAGAPAAAILMTKRPLFADPKSSNGFPGVSDIDHLHRLDPLIREQRPVMAERLGMGAVEIEESQLREIEHETVLIREDICRQDAVAHKGEVVYAVAQLRGEVEEGKVAQICALGADGNEVIHTVTHQRARLLQHWLADFEIEMQRLMLRRVYCGSGDHQVMIATSMGERLVEE